VSAAAEVRAVGAVRHRDLDGRQFRAACLRADEQAATQPEGTGRIPGTNNAVACTWSGVAVRPKGPQSWVGAMGVWHVPEIVIPAGDRSDAQVFYSSTWVGLDGAWAAKPRPSECGDATKGLCARHPPRRFVDAGQGILGLSHEATSRRA
jgi:hypothetical protein